MSVGDLVARKIYKFIISKHIVWKCQLNKNQLI